MQWASELLGAQSYSRHVLEVLSASDIDSGWRNSYSYSGNVHARFSFSTSFNSFFFRFRVGRAATLVIGPMQLIGRTHYEAISNLPK